MKSITGPAAWGLSLPLHHETCDCSYSMKSDSSCSMKSDSSCRMKPVTGPTAWNLSLFLQHEVYDCSCNMKSWLFLQHEVNHCSCSMRSMTVLASWNLWLFIQHETCDCPCSMKPMTVRAAWSLWLFLQHEAYDCSCSMTPMSWALYMAWSIHQSVEHVASSIQTVCNYWCYPTSGNVCGLNLHKSLKLAIQYSHLLISDYWLYLSPKKIFPWAAHRQCFTEQQCFSVRW